MPLTNQVSTAADAQGAGRATRVVIPAFFVALPAVIFFWTLFERLANLPLQDDYDAVLRFINQTVQAEGAAAKLLNFLADQHNEYKLFFGHGVEWAQFALLGHVNFVQLCVLGDSAVLVLALILWSMFLPGEKDIAKRLAYFVPVAWLLFQLEYWETLDWAMASLQNLWVIVFSLGTVCCLVRPTRNAYTGALILYVLAIAASGNGFLLFPVGLLVFATRRQFIRAVGWLTVSAVCIAAYAYQYNAMSSQAPSHSLVFATLKDWRPDYAITFLGNAGAIAGAGAAPINVLICEALGAALLLLFGWLVWRGYIRRNPAVFCSVFFVLLTAVGVAGLRSDLGLTQGLSSRYTIYGALLLILAWSAVAEEFLQSWSGPLLHNNAYVAAAGLAILFGLCTDFIGYQDLARREREAIKGMVAFEQSAGSRSIEGPVLLTGDDNSILAALRLHSRPILIESIRLGVYQPPKF
jgi:hypothetical protein